MDNKQQKILARKLKARKKLQRENKKSGGKKSLTEKGNSILGLLGDASESSTLQELNASQVDELFAELRDGNKKIRRLEVANKLQRKWLQRTSEKLDALLRAQFYEGLPAEHPFTITRHRFPLKSQTATDGLVIQLLKSLPELSRTFVEIGCGRSGGNASILAEDLGWSGLMVDASEVSTTTLANRLSHVPGLKVVNSFVTPENINSLLQDNGFDGDVDILSIDIDSYDYWVLKAMDACRPKILCMEFNPVLGNEEALVVPQGSMNDSTPKDYRGASIRAISELAATKGYRPVVGDDNGVNAFFLREDVLPELPALDYKQIYHAPKLRFEVDREHAMAKEAAKPDPFEEFKRLGLELTDVS